MKLSNCASLLFFCLVLSGCMANQEKFLLAEFPKNELKTRNEISRSLEISPDQPINLDPGMAVTFELDPSSLKLPEQIEGQERQTFFSTHFEFQSSDTQLEWFSVIHGGHEVQAAPAIGSKEWQNGVLVLPFKFDLSQPLSIVVKASAPLTIKNLTGLHTFDSRYLRAPCSMREFIRSGVTYQNYDYHEIIEYKPKPGKKRVVIVGNSTIDGCGDQIHGTTINMLLQHALNSRFESQYEVVNGGIGGASLIGHIISLVSYAPIRQKEIPNIEYLWQSKNERPAWVDLSPDLIVLAAHWNDIVDFREYLKIGRDARGKFVVHTYLEALFDFIIGQGSADIKVLRSMYDELERKKMQLAGSHNELSDEDYFEHFKFLNDKFLDFSNELLPEAEVVLLTLPNISPYSDFDERLQSKVFEKISKERQIKFIDAAGRFNQLIKKDEALAKYARNYMFTDSIHMTQLGRQWVVNELQKEIRFGIEF